MGRDVRIFVIKYLVYIVWDVIYSIGEKNGWIILQHIMVIRKSNAILKRPRDVLRTIRTPVHTYPRLHGGRGRDTEKQSAGVKKADITNRYERASYRREFDRSSAVAAAMTTAPSLLSLRIAPLAINESHTPAREFTPPLVHLPLHASF